MKVLMFGWEFPPKIYGGLAVASYGITKGLSLQGDVEDGNFLPKYMVVLRLLLME